MSLTPEKLILAESRGCGARRCGVSDWPVCGPRRRAFTLAEVLIVIAIIGMLMAILLPALNAVRDSARRIQCMSQMRQVALGVLQYHDARRRFPLVTSSPVSLFAANPGSTQPGSEAGSSWISQTLPYLEQTDLYDAFAQQVSGNGGQPAFSAALLDVNGERHVSERPVALLRCPSFSGQSFVDVGVAQEYQSQGTNLRPAISNYMALAGTHIDETGTDPDCPTGVCENGVLVSSLENGGRGLRQLQLRDGTSNTLMLAESRETAYASWYDGQTSWVIAAPDPQSIDVLPNVTSDGRRYRAKVHAINFGPGPASSGSPHAAVYLKGGSFPGNGQGGGGGGGNSNGGGQGQGGQNGNGGGNGNGQGPSGEGNSGNGVGNTGPGNQGNEGTMGNAGGGVFRPTLEDRAWGPSSEHGGRLVVHAFADGHVRAIPEDVAADVYLGLVTRNGGDEADLDTR
ncbi:MAG: DUF1559 domain-containing protein [Pirellulales bacterium]